MPQPAIKPLAHLSIHPFAVAHKLQMPAALFQAFKKTACVGNRDNKTLAADFQEAIDCLTRYETDIAEGLITVHVPHSQNMFFLSDAREAYLIYLQKLISCSETNDQANLYRAAYMALTPIFNLHDPWYAESSYSKRITEAKESLAAALFWAELGARS